METSAKSKKAPAKAEAPSQDAKRVPEKSFRVEDCSASVWTREVEIRGKPTIFRTITFERSYKDRDGAWRYTKSFDPESLGKMVTLCQQASEYITDRQQEAE
jgi:hypothetical protein